MASIFIGLHSVHSLLRVQPESDSSPALSNQPFEVPSHVQLDLLRLFGIGSAQILNGSRDGDLFAAFRLSAGFTAESALNAWGPQPPFRHQAVCRQSPMERAGSAAVEIGHITTNNSAKLSDVEIGDLELKRIERPFDQIDAASKCFVALRKLEPAANAAILVVRKHREQVRVKVSVAFAKSREGQDEPYRHVSVKGGENLPAGLGGNDKDVVGNRLQFGIAPDDSLQGHAHSHL